MKIQTTYGRTDISKQLLELSVIAVGNEFAVTAQFNGNGTHRTVKTYSSETAGVIMKDVAKRVRTREFPWDNRVGQRQWKRLEDHDIPF